MYRVRVFTNQAKDQSPRPPPLGDPTASTAHQLNKKSNLDYSKLHKHTQKTSKKD